MMRELVDAHYTPTTLDPKTGSPCNLRGLAGRLPGFEKVPHERAGCVVVAAETLYTLE